MWESATKDGMAERLGCAKESHVYMFRGDPLAVAEWLPLIQKWQWYTLRSGGIRPSSGSCNFLLDAKAAAERVILGGSADDKE